MWLKKEPARNAPDGGTGLGGIPLSGGLWADRPRTGSYGPGVPAGLVLPAGSLADLLDASVRRYGSRTALEFFGAGTSYRELGKLVGQGRGACPSAAGRRRAPHHSLGGTYPGDAAAAAPGAAASGARRTQGPCSLTAGRGEPKGRPEPAPRPVLPWRQLLEAGELKKKYPRPAARAGHVPARRAAHLRPDCRGSRRTRHRAGEHPFFLRGPCLPAATV